jgi:hypothetical protein
VHDHAPFKIDDVLGKAKFADKGDNDCGEGLVDLDPPEARFRGVTRVTTLA